MQRDLDSNPHTGLYEMNPYDPGHIPNEQRASVAIDVFICIGLPFMVWFSIYGVLSWLRDYGIIDFTKVTP